MTTRAQILIGAATIVAASGCNLSVPASDFVYEGPFIVIFTDTGGPDDDAGVDAEVDLPAPAPPELIITEVLIESTLTQLGLGEVGEFIEIKNVGEGPADPRNISLLLIDPGDPDAVPGRIQVARPTTAEEVSVVGALQPIEPGDYFVFVRYESAEAPFSGGLEPGSTYDYGRYAAGPTLSNVQPRVLEVRYASGTDVFSFDEIRWEGGELQPLEDGGSGLPYPPDVSIGVRADAETASDNDDPANWCLSGPSIGSSRFRGTPGAASVCQ